jgi:twitching motility two-component system response regulator PilG
MQGNLNEIDIRSILQLIELGQRTGELFVEAYGINSGNTCGGRDNVRDSLVYRYPYRDKRSRSCDQSWFVFFSNGQIIYAANTDTSLSRLRDFLRRYNAESALDSITNLSISATNALEYGYLWALLENHILTPAQGRSIIQGMVRETLFDLLSLHQGSFIFEMGPALAPQLTTLEIAPLVTKIIKQVQEWKQFHPHIQSPNQCPVISDAAQMREALPENTFNNLNRWADGTTNLRQMSRYLNRDILTVARAIYPFVQLGLVQLFYPNSSLNGDGLEECDVDQGFKIPRVVCIEDDITVGKTVEAILAQYGYEVSALMNPLKALSLVFQLKPDLILCDITMPELDGYEICAMLRHSSAFRQTPIVMLTGKDGFIDRVKARMVGATDYLTKPFGSSELLTIVEKYIGPGDPEHPEPDRVLAEVIEAEL